MAKKSGSSTRDWAFLLVVLLFGCQTLYMSEMLARQQEVMLKRGDHSEEDQDDLESPISPVKKDGAMVLHPRHAETPDAPPLTEGGTEDFPRERHAERNALEQQPSILPRHNRTTPNTSIPRRQASRVLLGIFTAAQFGELQSRVQYRKLFGQFATHGDNRVCHLQEAQRLASSDDSTTACQLIYTFVVGANQSAPPSLNPNQEGVPLHIDPRQATNVTRQGKRGLLPFSLTFQGGWTGAFPADYQSPDMTFLNVRENMNEGKTPSWFYFAYMLSNIPNLDYVAKCDSDTILDLVKYFCFADRRLLPAPRAMYVGKVMDKLWWGHSWKGRQSLYKYSAQDRQQYEGMVQKYTDFLPKSTKAILHLYMAGQWYLLSMDLVETVVQQLALPNHTSYWEGAAEDHDLSAMLHFHQGDALQLVMLSPQDEQFWGHPFKFVSTRKKKRSEHWQKVGDRTVRGWAETQQRLQRYLEATVARSSRGRHVKQPAAQQQHARPLLQQSG